MCVPGTELLQGLKLSLSSPAISCQVPCAALGLCCAGEMWIKALNVFPLCAGEKEPVDINTCLTLLEEKENEDKVSKVSLEVETLPRWPHLFPYERSPRRCRGGAALFGLCFVAVSRSAIHSLVPSFPVWCPPLRSPVPCRVAGSVARGVAAEGCPCLAEPRINASEDVVLHVVGVAVTLQCNLTSSPSPLAASYWVKNGEEIPGTRKLSNTTEYRCVPATVRAVARVHLDTQRGLLFFGVGGVYPARLLKEGSVAAHLPGGQNPSWKEKWGVGWARPALGRGGMVFLRILKARAEESGEYLCVFVFSGSPVANATIEGHSPGASDGAVMEQV
ncbi:hypothetical protein IHE44_0002613 [Lamprotornis superbus]|uniref:Ig-like domain-containing protein n=1 Tax=Lamprotornis superbus TaxID=245042 RepID=A0A835TMP5_9PASS|nr:hypothetical protein IHE44_0002613 [Lamprotornis superbus]